MAAGATVIRGSVISVLLQMRIKSRRYGMEQNGELQLYK
jgi:hypothetical protein